MGKKKGGLKKLWARFETTKKQIDKVQKDGADVNQAIELLKKLENYLDKGDEAEAIKILGDMKLLIKQAMARKKYEMMIFNSLPMIEKAKRTGANVEASEALLDKARELLAAGEFGDAHEQIKLARREADNAKRFMTAKAQIQRVSPLVEAAKKKGVDVRDATRALLDAWKALNEGNYKIVSDLMKEATTFLTIAEEQKSYEISIKDMEARIAAVSESGMDTQKMEALLDEAKQALKREEFGNVRTNVNKIRREIEKIILHREAGLTVRTIQQFVREAKRAGIKSGELEDLVEKASVAIKEGDISRVRSIELSAKQAVKNLKLFDTLSAGDIGIMDKEREAGLMALIKEELADSKRLTDRARASGMDASEIEKLIESTEISLNAGHLNESVKLMKQVSEFIHDEKSGFQAVKTMKNLEEMLAALEEAKAIGIDVTEAEVLAAQAKAMEKEGQSVTEAIKKANLSLEEAVKRDNADKHPRLRVRVHSDGLEAQKWGRARVELSNTGNSIAKNIDVRFFGDVEAKGWEVIPKLLPGQNDKREVALKVFKPGKVPLDMTVNYEKSFDNTKFQLNDMKDVDVTEPGTFLVEDVFLIHNNGLLISKQTRRIKEEVDGDLFGAMLMAVSQFAKESFSLEEKVALNRLEFGDNQVMIERGELFFVAVTVQGEESVYMPFYISEVVREIEEKFGDILEEWEGDMSQLEGIDDVVKKLLLIESTESGIPDFGGSVLHPVVESIRNGIAIPDFEKNIKELLMSFEEELISGEMEDAEDLAVKIKETANEYLGSARGNEGKNKDNILKDSMKFKVETVRRRMEKMGEAGADLSREGALLQDSLALLESDEYEKARKNLSDIDGLLGERERAVAAEGLSKRLDELKSTLEAASKINVDVSDIGDVVRDIEKQLAEGQGDNIEMKFKDIGDKLGQRTRAFMANKYPKLQVEIKDIRGHEAGNWSRMGVVLNNRGNTPARNIDLNFSGDVEVKDPGPVELIEPNSSREIELSVRPAKDGKLPVDISATYQRYFDETRYQLNDMKDLDVQSPGSYIVEDAFLIHNTGLLIGRQTRRIKEEVDSDLFSAMLKALTDFVRQAFNISKKGGLDRMEFGGKKLLIEKGRFVFLAITITGDESAYLPLFMTELIRDIENKYGNVLEDWNGEMKPLEGIEEMIQKIIFVRHTGDEKIPMYDCSILAPLLEKASEGGTHIEDIERNAARIAETLEAEGMDAALEYLAEMEKIVSRLTAIPGTGVDHGESIDAGALKKRMYDIMIRSGHMDQDSALMDARLNNYLEVVGRISDAVFNLRETNNIPVEQTLARIAIKHSDHDRWGEVLENMRALIKEQTNAVDVRVLKPDDIWCGLVPKVDINEEHIRNSYKHIARKIISVLKYMPPDKLLANIKKGTFTIGVEGQQVYISDDMISVSFSLPPGAFEGDIDSGTIYMDTAITGENKADMSLNALTEKVMAMRREAEIEEDGDIEVLILASDAMVEMLEKSKDAIAEKCGAYDVLFPLDDPFGDDEYYVGELELDGETCKIGIAQVVFDD